MQWQLSDRERRVHVLKQKLGANKCLHFSSHKTIESHLSLEIKTAAFFFKNCIIWRECALLSAPADLSGFCSKKKFGSKLFIQKTFLGPSQRELLEISSGSTRREFQTLNLTLKPTRQRNQLAMFTPRLSANLSAYFQIGSGPSQRVDAWKAIMVRIWSVDRSIAWTVTERYAIGPI